MQEYKYERDYDKQPDDEWMLCPWHDDPEEREGTKGDYAIKCVCPNCVYYRYANNSIFGRLEMWLVNKGVLSQKCLTCRRFNDCTAEEGDCGWTGRVEAFKIENGMLKMEMADE